MWRCALLLVLLHARCPAALLHPDRLGEAPGPWVWPTRGEVWPKPQHLQNLNNGSYMVVRTNTFSFKVTGRSCDIVEAALARYYRVLVVERDAGLRAYRPRGGARASEPWFTDAGFRGYLDQLQVELTAPCEALPHMGMLENYELHVDSPELPGAAKLVSQSVWGILRGLETFVQLVAPSALGTELHINSSVVTDFPRFAYRGLMVDSVRHFHPLAVMMGLVDGMEASKLNTLHWHLVDDQAFPYQSKVFPELSEKGAYHPFTHVYSQDDIKALIEYCRLRGIRVLPEFDSPGHTRSWGESHPELLTTCYKENGEPDGSLGPLDPTKPQTYDFVKTLFTEVTQLFPDKYVHLGGDEVNFTCWQSNAHVRAFMSEHALGSDYSRLEELYISHLLNLTEELGAAPLVWQEVFDNGLALSADTVVHVWMGGHEQQLNKITSAGHLALLSSCWYLDHDGDWKEFYSCDPHSFYGTAAQEKLVIGGEACIWSEFVDGGSISQRVFPRASAMGERLWSSAAQTDTVEAARRLGEFRCRLLRRGVQARPVNGPGFCPGEDDADWPGVPGAHRVQGLAPDQTFVRDQAYKKWIGDVGRINAMKK